MQEQEFEQLVEEIFGRVKQILASKGKEYARGDRLSNFKKAGTLAGSSPERALLGMLIKHWVSIVEIINDLERDKSWHPDIWREKLTDNIAYSLLLEALLQERF
jgi:hypothetical protein